MSTATLTSAPTNTLRQQFAKLRRALGNFFQDMLAAQDRIYGVSDVASLADQHQQHSPSLSTELRSIASRG